MLCPSLTECDENDLSNGIFLSIYYMKRFVESLLLACPDFISDDRCVDLPQTMRNDISQ
jgi:hypothetical protein